MAVSVDSAFLATTRLFKGTKEDEVESMLGCLGARSRAFGRGEGIYHMGQQVDALGLVLSGAVRVESVDVWGNVSIMGQMGPGAVFAEVYAALPDEPLMADVIAATDCEVLFLDVARILSVCSHACTHHAAVSRNLLDIFARKNLNLARKISYTAPKTIRGKLLSYLSAQAQQQGSSSFDIPFNRQQLADYLGVDRSAMSSELGRMQREGLLSTRRSHFELNEDFDLA